VPNGSLGETLVGWPIKDEINMRLWREYAEFSGDLSVSKKSITLPAAGESICGFQFNANFPEALNLRPLNGIFF
jgi:hypothetical protein